MPEVSKERNGLLYKLLGQPWAYQLALALISPGGWENVRNKIKEVIDLHPEAHSYLDVGCGPRSGLNDFGLKVVGLDISLPYVINLAGMGNSGVQASVEHLPFKDGSFDAVWTVGLLHHLPEELFQAACLEMLRVCHKGGYVAIIDAVKPHSFWKRPIPAVLRELDRGRYMRDQEQFESLVSEYGKWGFQRYTYSYHGLEAIFALQIKE